MRVMHYAGAFWQRTTTHQCTAGAKTAVDEYSASATVILMPKRKHNALPDYLKSSDLFSIVLDSS